MRREKVKIEFNELTATILQCLEEEKIKRSYALKHFLPIMFDILRQK